MFTIEIGWAGRQKGNNLSKELKNRCSTIPRYISLYTLLHGPRVTVNLFLGQWPMIPSRDFLKRLFKSLPYILL
jgi:hypothetical protein